LITLPLRIFLDADIFFDLAENKKNIKSLINHLLNDGHILYTSITVLGEIVLICLRDKDKDLHKIVDLLPQYNLLFLIPNDLLRDCCKHLDLIDKNDRIAKTDKTHLAYAIAYDVDYYLTNDGKLLKFSPIKECMFFSKKDRIISPSKLREKLKF
jgi:predicted nucleic acid-binding protein